MAFSNGTFGKIFRRRKVAHDENRLSNHVPATSTGALSAVNGCGLGSKESKAPRIGSESKGMMIKSQRAHRFPLNEISTLWLILEESARDISSLQWTAYPYGSRSLSVQVAAVKSLFPSQDHSTALHRVSKSTDLNYQKPISGKPGRRPHSALLPNGVSLNERTENYRSNQPPQLAHKRNAWRLSTGALENATNTSASRLQHNQALNPSGTFSAHLSASSHSNQSECVQPGSSKHGPALLTCQRRGLVDVRPHSICGPIFAYEERRSSLSRKPHIPDLRRASEPDHARCLSVPLPEARSRRGDVHGRSFTRAHLDKPLPPIPLQARGESEGFCRSNDDFRRSSEVVLSPEQAQPQVRFGPHDAETKVNMSYHERWSPSVTHETITKRVHEVREEQITREIHNHHVYHRTLPVMDLELLPARHFLSTENGLVEVAKETIPAEMRPAEDWLRSEMVSKVFPNGDDDCSYGRSQIYHAMTNDIQEYKDADGMQRLESKVMHPVVIEPPNFGAEKAYTVRLSAA